MVKSQQHCKCVPHKQSNPGQILLPHKLHHGLARPSEQACISVPNWLHRRTLKDKMALIANARAAASCAGALLPGHAAAAPSIVGKAVAACAEPQERPQRSRRNRKVCRMPLLRSRPWQPRKPAPVCAEQSAAGRAGPRADVQLLPHALRGLGQQLPHPGEVHKLQRVAADGEGVAQLPEATMNPWAQLRTLRTTASRQLSSSTALCRPITA